ncbi:hypothetical protein AB2N08_13265 [Massilia aurea]|uniref:hypothetical protein n=1 Tax=Massilia aurea TaxID=373040 RepID=UPI0034619D48
MPKYLQQRQAALLHQMRHDVRGRIAMYRNKMEDVLTEGLSDIVEPIVDEIRTDLASEKPTDSVYLLRGLGIYTADIEQNCSELKRQVLNNRYEQYLHAVVLSDQSVVPIADALVERISEFTTPPAFQLDRAPTEQVLDGFYKALKSFVLRRLIGQFMFPRMDALVGGPMFSGGTMLSVKVTSKLTSGARVEYSPIYYIAFTVLAAPTSPVRGLIPPGRYIFKLTTIINDLYDRGIFDVPHDFDIRLNV